MRWWLLAAGIASILVTEGAGADPEEFYGVRWGASVDEARKSFRTAGVPPREAFCYSQVCLWDRAIGSTPIRLVYEFSNSRFVRGVVQFAPADYAAVRQMFIDLYGSPTNRAAERSTWNGDRVRIELSNGAAQGRGTVSRSPGAIQGLSVPTHSPGR